MVEVDGLVEAGAGLVLDGCVTAGVALPDGEALAAAGVVAGETTLCLVSAEEDREACDEACARPRTTAAPGFASNTTPATTAAPADVAAKSR